MRLPFRTFKIKLIHRQIFRDLAVLFSMSVGVLLALILIGRMLQLRDMFLVLDLSLWELLKLFFFLVPFFLLLLNPISCMLSVFLTFLRMSTDRELLALRANGYSLYQLLPAPIIFCLLITGLNYFIAVDGLAWGMRSFRAEIADMLQNRSQLVLQPGIFNREIPGITFYASRLDPATGEMESVFVRDRTTDTIDITVVAKRGRFELDPGDGAIVMDLGQGRIYRRTGEEYGVLRFDNYVIRLPLSRLLKDFDDFFDVRPKEMSLSQLYELKLKPGIDERDDGKYLRKVRVEMQKRYSLPLACFVLGLFAIPIACAFRGLKQSFGLAVSLVLFLAYYTMFSIGVGLGEAGAISPVFGLWAPNVIFLFFAVAGIRSTARERTVRFMDWIPHLLPQKKRRRERA